MIRLLWMEFKHLFLKRSTLCLFLLMIVFVTFNTISEQKIVYENSYATSAYRDDGTLVEGKELLAYINQIKNEYAGVITTQWQEKVEKDLEKAEKEAMLIHVDRSAMIEQYGKDWLTQFEQAPDTFVAITKEDEINRKEFDEGTFPFYVKDYIPLIRESTLFQIKQDGNMILSKPWVNLTKNEYKNQFGETHTMVDYLSLRVVESKEQLKIFQDKMNQIPEFHYGSYHGWDALIRSLASFRFILAIFIVYVTSSTLNKDYSSHTIDIIKTTSLGKSKIVIAKLAAITLTCISIVACYCLIPTLFVYFYYGLGNWNINMSFLINTITPYTFQQAYIGGALLLLAGSITTGFISACISAYLRKGFVSFAISLLFLVLPSAVSSGFSILFPVNYMDFSGIYFNCEMLELWNKFYFAPTFIYGFTGIVFIIGIALIISRYRSYAVTKTT